MIFLANNQIHEPRKIINNLNPKNSNPRTQNQKKSNFMFSQSNQPISQQTYAHKVTKPTTTIVDQTRERKRDSGLEREKKSKIEQRKKQKLKIACCAHVVNLLCLFFCRSPLLILLGRSSALFFLSAVVWDIFQPTQFESKSSQIERDKD